MLKFSEDYPVARCRFARSTDKTGKGIRHRQLQRRRNIHNRGVIGDNSRILMEKTLACQRFRRERQFRRTGIQFRNRVVGDNISPQGYAFMNYALPSDEIINFLDKAQKTKTFPLEKNYHLGTKDFCIHFI